MKDEVESPKPAQSTLVCFALPDEAGAFRQRCAERKDISILITGIGKRNAGMQFRDFLENIVPERVFTCGFAGGLNPDLVTGDVVYETRDAALARRLSLVGVRPAKFFCAPFIATTGAEKSGLRHATGADAVEMESEIIHAICGERGISCATVRVISDTAHEDLPLDFNKLSKPDLSINYGKLAWAIAKSPGKIPALLRLQKSTRFAAQRLAEVLSKVIAPK